MIKPKKILVVGGCGYIGSHMVQYLLGLGYDVVVLDDLSTGYADALVGGTLVVGSCGDRAILSDLFGSHEFNAVMHFASFIQVGESVAKPSDYYQNNFSNTLSLLSAMKDFNLKYFIFSSTAAVFGEPKYTPIDEMHPINPINPYGKSKRMVEMMLEDFDIAYGLRSVSLRYFNAAGADPSSALGERHNPETHLIPLAIRAGLTKLKTPLKIFGADYNTPDGTCVRDYIHVQDLCAAHLLALEYLWAGGESNIFNLGNGMGFSVKEVIGSVERIMNVEIPCANVPRRSGDPERLIADSNKAKKILAWEPVYPNIDDIVSHAYFWALKNPH